MRQYVIDNYIVEVEDIRNAVYKPYNFNYSDGSSYMPSKFGIKIYNNSELINSATISAVGGGTTLHDYSLLLEGNRLVICCANVVFCLSIPSLSLLWQTQVEWATCFGIFKYQNDYIVHGETTISRLNPDGDVVWQQSGADIFVTMEGKDDFRITENHIEATDFEYRKYRFDYDGNSLPVTTP